MLNVFKGLSFRQSIYLFLAVIIPTSYGEAGSWKTDGLNLDSLDSNEMPSFPSSPTLSPYISFSLGLGHYDNLSRIDSAGLPQLKPNNLNWVIHLQLGISYGITTTYLHLSGSSPVPVETKVGAYNHVGWLTDAGMMSQVRLLPVRGKYNLCPIIGYTWLREEAKIYDPDKQLPTQLDIRYSDDALLLGAELDITIHRGPREDLRLGLKYIHQHFRDRVNRFRLELHDVVFNAPEPTLLREMPPWKRTFQLSPGFEYITRSSGRQGWFVVVTILLENVE